jgi:hypothetical protein
MIGQDRDIQVSAPASQRFQDCSGSIGDGKQLARFLALQLNP